MKAPLSTRIKAIINKREHSLELMKSVIDGQRTGNIEVTIAEKTYQLKQISANNNQK